MAAADVDLDGCRGAGTCGGVPPLRQCRPADGPQALERRGGVPRRPVEQACPLGVMAPAPRMDQDGDGVAARNEVVEYVDIGRSERLEARISIEDGGQIV